MLLISDYVIEYTFPFEGRCLGATSYVTALMYYHLSSESRVRAGSSAVVQDFLVPTSPT